MKQVLVLVGVPVALLAALAVFLFARAGHSAPAPATSAPSAGYTPVGMVSPTDCKLAVLDWADAAESMSQAAVFGSDPGQRVEAAVGSTLNRIKVYCFPKAAAEVATLNYRLALAAAQSRGAGLSIKRAQRLGEDILLLKSDLAG